MPELTWKDVPDLLQRNREIRSEVTALLKRYLQNLHPKGWDIVDGAREYLKTAHVLIEAPVQDPSFGGFIRSTPHNRFICYINTAQPRMYQNFSLLHELYHVISLQELSGPLHLIHTGLDQNKEERKADYFASLLLMDEHELMAFYTGTENAKKDVLTKVVRTISRFKAPYKAILIRLYELGLLEDDDFQALFDNKLSLHAEFQTNGLDPYILEKSMVIDFGGLELLMQQRALPELAQTTNLRVLDEIYSYFAEVREEEKRANSKRMD